MPSPRYFLAMLSFIAVLAVAPANGADGCTLTAQEFVQQLSTMKDWRTIYAVFKHNLPRCPDDGMFAEGYSDVVVHGLAKHWRSIQELQTITASDPAFLTFVIRHVDATADAEELKQTLRNATTRCPVGASVLCKQIGAGAAAAIEELK